MADIAPDTFKVVQSYGGLKEAFVVVDSATAADVLKFTADQRVAEVQFVSLQTGADGAAVGYTIGGTDNNEITVGAGPSAEEIKAVVKYRSY